MKTSELTGRALDWAVAKCEGADEIHFGDAEQFLLLHSDPIEPMYHFCDDWSQGGPIIEQERIGIRESNNEWRAEWWADNSGMAKNPKQRFQHNHFTSGPTPLVAAMRAYVASRLGLEVEIPQELV